MLNFSPDGQSWSLIPNFDGGSRYDYCSVTGQRKKDDDEGVIRPLAGFIDQEGYFDITKYAAEQLATMLGWAPPETVDHLRQEIADLRAEQDRIKADTWKRAQDAVKMAGVRARGTDA